MNIVVLGAGAMGSIIGAFLKRGGANVTLVDPFRQHMDKISKDGLKLFTYEMEDVGTTEFDVAYSMDGMSPPDVIVFMVKSTASREALKGAAIGKNTYVFTCQNGLGNVEVIEEFVPRERILAGSLNITGTLIEPGAVKYRPMGNHNISLGSVTQNQNSQLTVKKLQDYLEKGGFSTKYYEQVMDAIWEKALFNITNNPIAALVRLQRVQVRVDSDGVDLARTVAKEVESVARAKGINSISADAFMSEVYLNMSPQFNTVGHYPSMAQDVMMFKRKTEIDALNGAIVRFGKELGIPTPANEVLTQLIKIIEKNYDIQYYG